MSFSSNSRDDSKQSELRYIDFRLFTISEHVFNSVNRKYSSCLWFVWSATS